MQKLNPQTISLGSLFPDKKAQKKNLYLSKKQACFILKYKFTTHTGKNMERVKQKKRIFDEIRFLYLKKDQLNLEVCQTHQEVIINIAVFWLN
jgi:hypothetical protein